MSAREWIKGLMTGADNKTPDMARHGWLFANLTILIAAIITAVQSSTVSLTELAMALGIVNGSGAASTMATKSSQPKPKEHEDATIVATNPSGKTQAIALETNTGGSASVDSPD